MLQRETNWKKKTILFLISQSITLFGSQTVQMAIIWYVTLHIEKGAWVAAFSVCSYLPQFLISFWGGVWADRCDRKRLIIGADAGIAAVTAGMFFGMPYISKERELLAALLLLSTLRSVGAGIQSPAVNTVIPKLVPKEALIRYNGINAAMQSFVQFASPAAAGAVLTVGTLRASLLMDILTAAAGIGIFFCVRLPEQEKRKETVSLFGDLRAGIRYAFVHKAVGNLLLLYGAITFLCVPAGYLSTLLVSRIYGSGYAYLAAAELGGFGGMMAGGLFISIWGGFFKERRKTLSIGLAVFGLTAAGMGLVQNFVVYLFLMFVYGIALTALQTTITTSLQENVRLSVQGRVFGFMNSLYSVSYPAGMALFGPMADKIPLQWIMVASGLGILLIGILWGRKPSEAEPKRE